MKSIAPREASVAILLVLLICGHLTAGDQLRPSTTGILGAFSDEVAILEQALTDARPQTILGIRFVTGTLKGRSVVLASSGVGKVNAAMCATLLVDHFMPGEIIFSGIAGSINPELHPGDIVIGEKTAHHDMGTLNPEGMHYRGMRSPVDWQPNPVFLDADPRLLLAAEAARKRVNLEKIQTSEGERTPAVFRGIIVTGDVFVASPAKKEELRKALNADAVEMEGAAVAQVCRELGVPCLVIRSISDTADARARQDASLFFPIAAQNSALFVQNIVEQLTASTPQVRH
jgi:adenosylhomocysteine nucleosidase